MEFQKKPDKKKGPPPISGGTFYTERDTEEYTEPRTEQKPKAPKRKKNSFYYSRPKVTAAVIAGVLAVSIAGTVVSNVVSRPQPHTIAEESVSTYIDEHRTEMDFDSVFSLENTSWFMDGDTLVYTMEVNRKLPDVETLYSGVDIKAESDLTDGNDYLSIPRMDFYTDQVYVSGTIYGFTPFLPDSSTVGFQVEPNDERVEVWSPLEYDYIVKKENPTEDQVLQAYPIVYKEKFHDIEMVDDGVAGQSGKVTFTVTHNTDDNYSDFGDVNIVFKKDGTAIFGDIFHIDKESHDPKTKTYTYVCEYNLPEYDEVEIMDLH